MQTLLAEVHMASDGRLYKHIKYSFQYESYLNLRYKALRVFNIFNIERGRWNRVDRNERKCVVCDCIEDEFHCLIKCPIFNNERRGLLTTALENNPNMHHFINFLISENVKEQKKLGLLCLKIQKEYKNQV